jgi:hypothetical protein
MVRRRRFNFKGLSLFLHEKRYRILDFERLKALLGGVEAGCFRRHDEALILETIAKDSMKRDPIPRGVLFNNEFLRSNPVVLADMGSPQILSQT